ncbi:MAG: gliding motility-associated C-terminal domain-containing protein [Bacteroidota bacterium]
MKRLLTLFCCLVAACVSKAQDCNAFLFLGLDTTICEGADIQLQVSGLPAEVLNFNWTPAGLTVSSDNSSATDSPSATTTYGLEVRYVTGPELVNNGDFSAGDTGFSTDYTFGNSSGGNGPLDDQGQYRITTSPPSVHDDFGDCGDHTSGNGNMMVINGSDDPVNVWCQTINVDAGIEYAFSAWVNTMVAQNPAMLQFSINGTLIGSTFTAPNQVCVWDQFFALWNSGANTSAELCIRNMNTNDTGNDFALDDISFRRTCVASAERTVTVDMTAQAEIDLNNNFCQGSSDLSLADLLTAESTSGGNWTLDGAPINSSLPISTLSVGAYELSYSVGNAECSATDSRTFNIVEPPNAGVAIDEGLYCQGQGGTFSLPDLLADFEAGGTWALPAELSGIPFSPISGVVDLNGTSAGSYDFTYTVSGASACPADVAVVTVEVASLPSVDTPLPDLVLDCNLPEVFVESGIDPGLNIVWSLDGSPFSTEPNITVNQAGEYAYTITDPSSACSSEFSFSVSAEDNLPTFDIMLDSLRCTADNQVDNGRVEFLPDGGNGPFVYSIDGQNFQAEPVFENLEAGVYNLIMEDAGGCRSSREVSLLDPLDFSFGLTSDIQADFTYGSQVGVFLQTNLSQTELANIIWGPAGIADIGARSVQFILDGPLTVQASVTTNLGCTFSAEIELVGQNGQILFAPSAFSPNDDGANDRWIPFGGPNVNRLLSVQIFDRWGSPVFQTNDQQAGDLSAGWDGRFRGREAPVGVYAYAVEVLLFDGTTQQETGSLTLIR